jgi:nitrosocyanin
MNENLPTENMQADMGRKSNLLAIIGVVIIVALIAFVMVQVSSRNQTENESPVEEANEVIEEPGETQTGTNVEVNVNSQATETDSQSVVEIEMEAGSFYYSPSTITVNKGTTVKVTITSKDMSHDFIIDELDVKSGRIDEGETATIEFVADQVGEFEFYCSVGTHRALGMVGTLIVTE